MASVLVVDDDADGSEPVVRTLERGGHRVMHATTGREALAVFPLVVPDVIVLDMLMPEMDGLSFLKVLRGYYRGFSMPVIVLTAAWDTNLTDRVLALGVKKVFRKSEYQLSELLACVNELVPLQQTDPVQSALAQQTDIPPSQPIPPAALVLREQQHPTPFPNPPEPVPEPIPQPMPDPMPEPAPDPATQPRAGA